mgnify:CR=1 FL=1
MSDELQPNPPPDESAPPAESASPAEGAPGPAAGEAPLVGDAAALDPIAQKALGVTVKDEKTITFDLNQPTPYFHTLVGTWVIYPAKKSLIDAGGETWYEVATNQVGNGPWQVSTIDKAELKALKDAKALPTSLAQTWLSKRRPSWIVFPRTIAEVQAVVRACAAHGAAIVPSGGRTGAVSPSATPNSRDSSNSIRSSCERRTSFEKRVHQTASFVRIRWLSTASWRK